MRVDGLREGPVPVIGDAVDLRLDQQLRALSGLQLQGGGKRPQINACCSSEAQTKRGADKPRSRASCWTSPWRPTPPMLRGDPR